MISSSLIVTTATTTFNSHINNNNNNSNHDMMMMKNQTIYYAHNLVAKINWEQFPMGVIFLSLSLVAFVWLVSLRGVFKNQILLQRQLFMFLCLHFLCTSVNKRLFLYHVVVLLFVWKLQYSFYSHFLMTLFVVFWLKHEVFNKPFCINFALETWTIVPLIAITWIVWAWHWIYCQVHLILPFIPF